MRSIPFAVCRLSGAWCAALLLAVGFAPARAQLGSGSALVEPAKLARVTVAPVQITAGGSGEAIVTVAIVPSWHVNANPPSPDYMIPTELEVKSGFGVQVGKPIYPPPSTLKVGFEESELSVYGGTVTLRLPLTAAKSAVNGTHALTGLLRFQACNDQVCMAPTTVPVRIPLTVSGGVSAAQVRQADSATAVETTPEPARELGVGDSLNVQKGTDLGPGGRVASIPLRPAGTLDNALVRKLEQGGIAAVLMLFGLGLALNLTPCVYPMIGITVSMFGARRAAPPFQIFGMAVIYVLGMAVMYSGLGVFAAFTGGLFGGMLQNPLIQIGLGVMMIALALSMFGLYEFQPPAWLLTRLGGSGTVGVMGTFVSGLVVGVLAAPCIGPFISALLLVVGTKGDPWFGFRTFFTLAMGLGAPYLVLATFSNLLQRLPRSGEWMVWVKKVFGVILLTLGVFYGLLALAPDLLPWLLPLALVLGGAYLGFFEKSGEKKPAFRWIKRVSGAAAAVAGAVLVITTPTEGIAFESLTPERLQAAIAAGQPVMLDFTANWCAPCHELERYTFSDRRVRERARRFRAFRIDLTRYNSPESERWRRQYRIIGVPTVVFITHEGSEVREARVEEFMPPERFLEHMTLAEESGQRAAGE